METIKRTVADLTLDNYILLNGHFHKITAIRPIRRGPQPHQNLRQLTLERDGKTTTETLKAFKSAEIARLA